MGLLDSFFGKSINDEMHNEGLSEEEKQIMKESDYNPLNFEEEELEDDDYYNEDDE